MALRISVILIAAAGFVFAASAAYAQLPKLGASRAEVETMLGSGDSVGPLLNRSVYGGIKLCGITGTLFCNYVDDTLHEFEWSNVRPAWAIAAFELSGGARSDSLLKHCFNGNTWPIDSSRIEEVKQLVSGMYGPAEKGNYEGAPLATWRVQSARHVTLIAAWFKGGTIILDGGRSNR